MYGWKTDDFDIDVKVRLRDEEVITQTLDGKFVIIKKNNEYRVKEKMPSGFFDDWNTYMWGGSDIDDVKENVFRGYYAIKFQNGTDDKVAKGYKLLKYRKGKLYPLYIYRSEETHIKEWLPAKEGPRNERGKVVGKMELCFRPGWHLCDIPLATHIGVKDANGNIVAMHRDEVWCEVYYHTNVDYQYLANREGVNNKGIIIPKNAYLKYISTNGFYHYKTNPQMFNDWVISGEIWVERVLADYEVNEILVSKGLTPMPREGNLVIA